MRGWGCQTQKLNQRVPMSPSRQSLPIVHKLLLYQGTDDCLIAGCLIDDFLTDLSHHFLPRPVTGTFKNRHLVLMLVGNSNLVKPRGPAIVYFYRLRC